MPSSSLEETIMARRHNAAGDSKLGCILWLLILFAFAMVTWKAVPVKVHSSELLDYMTEQAQYASRASGEQLKLRILKRAEELNLPLEAKNLKVDRGEKRVRMVCHYTVPLEFPGYTYYWEFKHEVDRPVFII